MNWRAEKPTGGVIVSEKGEPPPRRAYRRERVLSHERDAKVRSSFLPSYSLAPLDRDF